MNDLYRAGSYLRTKTAESILNGIQVDMHAQACVWKYDQNRPRSRSKGTADGTARQYGEIIYRDNITDHACTSLYNQCTRCQERQLQKLVIDICKIVNTSYSPGARIIGDLDYYGWLLMRTNIIDAKAYSDIDELSRKSPPT